MTANPWHICVLIPARNEEDLLPRCLHSVVKACSVLPQNVTYDVVVVVDSSTDSTRTIAQSLLRGHGVVVSAEVGIVGKARAIAAAAALKRYDGSGGPLLACEHRRRLLRARNLASRPFVICRKRCRSHRRDGRRGRFRRTQCWGERAVPLELSDSSGRHASACAWSEPGCEGGCLPAIGWLERSGDGRRS